MAFSDYDPAFDSRVDHIWPELALGKIVLSPVRVGMNRETGAIMVGWDHTVQSASVIFATRFHERVLRRWVGSFVPQFLGESATANIITRFWWAVASALDIFEPNYSVKRVRVARRRDDASSEEVNTLTSIEELRTGNITNNIEGVHKPRGHLGDDTPEQTKRMYLQLGDYGMYARAVVP